MATCISTSYPIAKLTNNHSRSSLFFRKTQISTSTPPSQFFKPIPLAIRPKPHPFLPLPRISISCSSHHRTPPLLKSCTQGVAALLLGSLLFIGRFNIRPALALEDAPKSSSTEILDERVITENEEEDEELYVKILEQSPKDVEALKVVLYGKMKKGKTKEAVEYVERLIALEPDDVEWRLLQALSYELMGQISKAKRLFKEILKERPLLLRALHGLALAMYKNREGPAVFKMLDKALEIARRENRVVEERNIKILIAQMHVVKGDLEGASKHFQDLVNENPRDFRPYLCQGIIYSLLDKNKEAEEQFETYRSLVPSEFPQRGFIDDVILSAKTESQESFQRKL